MLKSTFTLHSSSEITALLDSYTVQNVSISLLTAILTAILPDVNTVQNGWHNKKWAQAAHS